MKETSLVLLSKKEIVFISTFRSLS